MSRAFPAPQDSIGRRGLQRRKQPFMTPVAPWFFAPGAPAFVDAALSKTALEDAGLLDWDIPASDVSLEQSQEQARLHDAWQRLDPVEQWVLEAMLVEEQDASDVLQALCKLQLRIDARVPPENTSRQQLYYFRRKTLAKLATLMGVE